MKATKTQITDVTRIANEMNVSVTAALSSLNVCSLSIYKVIGAKGVVECAAKNVQNEKAVQAGGILFAECGVLSVTEKAYLLFIPSRNAEKWVPKSVIKEVNGNTIVPFWAINR